MNYIVFDLEWNQGTEADVIAQMPFEIVEIGAVKLNQHLEQVDTFQVLVKPQAYPVMDREIHKIVHLEMEELQQEGIEFPKAADAFIKWCGTNYKFCTWGNMDLVELQRNLNYYQMPLPFQVPVYYYDIQKCYGMQYPSSSDTNLVCALEDAVEALHIAQKGSFHRAVDDAWYTAQIMKKLDRHIIDDHLTVDYYYNPAKKDEELFLKYPEYRMHVTREFDNKEDILKDAEVRKIRCHICGKPAKPKVRWFSINGRGYMCIGQCAEHGYVMGKIHVKKNDWGRIFAVKYLKMAGEEEARGVLMRRNLIREKRREKRKLKHQLNR